MQLLVAVKRVLDYSLKPRVRADQTGIDLANVKMSMNSSSEDMPFDVRPSIRPVIRSRRPSLRSHDG